MYAPKVIMSQFLGGGSLETVNAAALRIHGAQNMAYGAVLTGGIHSLQHDEERPLIFGVQKVLEMT